jgi:D-alanyl-D-alanine carboxypeptidase (penicillin-binding protein 5/6)
VAQPTSTSVTSTTLAPPTTVIPTTVNASTTTVPAMPSTTTVATDVPVDPSEPPSIDAAAYVVYDVGLQHWIAEHDADSTRPVGSLMKLLTAFVVTQAGDPTHVATVPALQLEASESSIGLYEGERLRRDVLLRAMLIVSANDAAHTLAVDVAGGEQAFVDQMNSAAQALGMVNTVAANPTGLDAPEGHSSARDMVVVASVLMEDPTFRATVARTDARLHGSVFPSTNPLLSIYEGVTGVKTGHTTGAGYCIVASATRDGRPVIVAVLGAPSDKARIDGATALLDWAFTQ